MAVETATELWIGTDHSFEFTILNDDQDEALDITGWALSWMVKKRLSYADSAALITKTTGSGITISGTFNATPASNTQKATVAVADTDTDGASAGVYYYELKRTDAGLETVLAYGEIELKRSVHRA